MRITKVSPEDSSVNVSTNQVFTIYFDKDIDKGSIKESMFMLLSADGDGIPLGVEVIDNKIEIAPLEPLMHAAKYSLYVSKQDFLSGMYISSTQGDKLENDFVSTYYVVLQGSNADEKPTNLKNVEVYPTPQVVNIIPGNYVLNNNQIVIEFNEEVKEDRELEDIVFVEMESISSETEDFTYEVETVGSCIKITLSSIMPAAFYYITFPDGVKLKNGISYIDGAMRFISKPTKNVIPISTIRYRLGNINSEISDYEIYTSILDAMQTINSKTNIDLTVSTDKKVNELLKSLVLYTIIERIAIENFSGSNNTVMIGNLSVSKRQLDTRFLDFLRKKLEDEINQIISVSEIRVAIRGKYDRKIYKRDFSKQW